MSEAIWIRCGDQDEYNSFDGYDEVASYLAEMRVAPPLYYCNDYGLEDDGAYFGDNYISAFWGDKDAQPTRGLTEDEVKEINDRLEGYANEYKRD